MPLTILVVDDDPAFRRAIVRLLTLRGFNVVADVADGKSALAAVQHRRPDAVLLDINLPDSDGICIARILTSQPGAPAIVLTSTDSCGYTDTALAECGARAFVPKDRLPLADLQSLLSPADI